MTTEELVKRLNTNNWLNWVDAELEVNKYGESYVTIYSPFGSEEIAVPCDATNWLNVHYDWSISSDEFTAPMREFISSLISQYLNTPVSKRKTEKKYRLEAVRHFSGPIAEKGYVKNVVCKTDYSGFEYSPVPFEFTEKQLETMKNNDPALAPAIDAMKEEVKDDAC